MSKFDTNTEADLRIEIIQLRNVVAEKDKTIETLELIIKIGDYLRNKSVNEIMEELTLTLEETEDKRVEVIKLMVEELLYPSELQLEAEKIYAKNENDEK